MTTIQDQEFFLVRDSRNVGLLEHLSRVPHLLDGSLVACS